MLRIAVSTSLAALAALSLPAAARADRFCVGGPCNGIPVNSFAIGLQGAENEPGPDEVVVAAGTYVGPFKYEGSDPVTISGAGPTATTLTLAAGTQNALTASNATVRDLRIRATGTGDHGALVLEESTAERVTVSSTTTKPAVRLGDGSTLRDATVTNTDGVGILASCTACTVERGSVKAPSALETSGTANLTGRALRLEGASLGVSLGPGLTTLSESVVVTTAPNDTVVSMNGGTLIGRHLTLVSRSGSAQSAGVAAVASAGPTNVVLDRSVIWGVGVSAFRASVGPVANLTLRASAWDRIRENVGPMGGPGAFVADAPVVDLAGRTPGFADALLGDFTPGTGSPLVDATAGIAAADWFDVAGRPAADGDGDGAQQPDIGALEAAAGTAPKSPAGSAGGTGAPGPATGGETVSGGGPGMGNGAAGNTGVVDARRENDTTGPAPDRTAPRCDVVVRRSRTATRIVVESTCDESVRIRLRARRVGRRAFQRTLTAPAGRSTRTLALGGRPRSGMAVSVDIVDAAGNGARRVRLNVLPRRRPGR